jgi:hypothetical protein
MNPGLLDCKILLRKQAPGLPLTDHLGNILTTAQGEVITTNSRRSRFGQEMDVWGTWRVRWARKIEHKASEPESPGRKIYEQPVTFKLRYTPGLNELVQIVSDYKCYDITSIIEIGRRQYHEVGAVYRNNVGEDCGQASDSSAAVIIGDLTQPPLCSSGVSIWPTGSCIQYDLTSYVEQSDGTHIYYSWISSTSGVYYAERLNLDTHFLDGRRLASLPRPVDLTTLEYNEEFSTLIWSYDGIPWADGGNIWIQSLKI